MKHILEFKNFQLFESIPHSFQSHLNDFIKGFKFDPRKGLDALESMWKDYNIKDSSIPFTKQEFFDYVTKYWKESGAKSAEAGLLNKKREHTIKLLSLIGTTLIIIGGIGGALAALRGLMVAYEKRKNKKETGSDKLTEKQEEDLYKIMVLSKIMIILGGVGGALRTFKFLLAMVWHKDWDVNLKTIFDSYTKYYDNILSEDIDYKKLVPEVTKLLFKYNNSNVIDKIADKLEKLTGFSNVIDSMQQKATGLEEDLIIQISKVSQVFDRILGPAEKTLAIKMALDITSHIKENNLYENINIEKLTLDMSKYIGMPILDNILNKVWDKRVESEMHTITNTKDASEATSKAMEIKKILDIKLDNNEKQFLIKIAQTIIN